MYIYMYMYFLCMSHKPFMSPTIIAFAHPYNIQ